jgi:hypothetical protein
MYSTPYWATKTITETDFAAEVTAAEDDDEGFVKTDSNANIDKTESAAAGITKGCRQSRSSPREHPPTQTYEEESSVIVVNHFKWLF